MFFMVSIQRWLYVALVGLCLLPMSARGQLLMDELPDSAKAIEVEDRVGEFIPLDLVFSDERGNKLGLGRFFNRGRPIVLTMNYSDCPGLCMAQLDNVVATLSELNGAGIGEKFDIVTVSIDPTEDSIKAARTKEKYVGMLRQTKAREGWHFLTGEQKSISSLARALGFHYAYDKASKRYSHAAVTYFMSPSGRICRYFVSLGEEPEQFKFALGDAAEGKLGASLSDSLVQMCYSYNPDSNRYTADARRMLSFGAAAFVLLLIGFSAPFWFSGRAVAKRPTSDSSQTTFGAESALPYNSVVPLDPQLSARHVQ